MENAVIVLADVLLLALALYGVGYCVLRLFGTRRLWAFACAPLVSITVIFVLTTLYAGVIPANFWTLVAIPFFLLAFIALLRVRLRPIALSKQTPLLLTLSLAVAALLFLLVYVQMAGDANNYAWLVDNAHHMSTALALTEKTNWSIFDPWSHTYYATGLDPLGENLAAGGFYPPVWQWLVAIPATVIKQNIAVAQNGLIVIVCAVVIPTGTFALTSCIFGERRDMRIANAVTSVSFVSFPWLLLVWGPLYPNLLSYALVMPAVVSFLLCFRPLPNKCSRIIVASTFVCGLLSLMLTQPNGIFTLGVFLAPFLVWQISRIPKLFCHSRTSCIVWRIIFSVLAIAAIVCLWIVLMQSSFLVGAANYYWPNFTTKRIAIQNVLTARFAIGYTLAAGPQYALAACILVGLVVAFVKKNLRWLAISYLLFAFMYIVCVGSDDPQKWFITGFWYNDSFRLSSALALVGIPLATLGLTTFAHGIVLSVRRLSPRRVSLVLLATMACFAVLNYWVSPAFSPVRHAGAYPLVSADAPDNDWPMGYPFQRVKFAVARDVNPRYTSRVAEKRAFMRKAAKMTGSDWIANYPLDGSLFAYPCEGLKTLVRSPASVSEGNALVDSMAAHLDELTTHHELAQNLHDLGVNFVIRLENEGAPRAAFVQNPDYAAWAGFYRINQKTPGFELMLEENGMELYRIKWEDIL